MTKRKWVWVALLSIIFIASIVIRLCGLINLSHVVSEFSVLGFMIFLFNVSPKLYPTAIRRFLIVLMIACSLSISVFSLAVLVFPGILVKGLAGSIELAAFIITAALAMIFCILFFISQILYPVRKL